MAIQKLDIHAVCVGDRKPAIVKKRQKRTVDSSCKCTTLSSLKDFGGCAVGETFTRSIIQLTHDVCKALGIDATKVAALGEVLSE